MTDEAPTPIRRSRRTRRAASTRAPRRTQSPGGIVASLRAQLNEQVKECPCCGSTTGNKSKMARDIGLSTMSLSKFLRGGRVNSDTVDAVYEYLQRQTTEQQ